MDFSMTLLCLSIIFSQCSRPSPDLNSRETTLQRLTYSGFLTASLPQGQELPTSVPVLNPTWENETSGVETHKWKLPPDPIQGYESLNCNL